MSQRRLLFVSPRYLFPADSGGKIRTGNVLRGMKGGTFEITLVSPAPRDAPLRDGSELGALCDRFVGWPEPQRNGAFQWTRMRHLASALPVSVATDYSAAGERAIAGELERRPDVVVIDFPHAAVLAPPPYPVPSVMFTHNVEAEIFQRHADKARDPVRRAIWRNQAAKMERYERSLLPQFSAVVAVADRDGERLRSAYGLRRVRVIPTGVDFDYFGYAPPPPLEDRGAGTLVFTAAMDSMANIDAVEHFMDSVWPLIARARPRARFRVVGRNPPAALVERARARGLQWEFTGFVDDVRPHVRQAHAYVIPLRVGSGTRIKVYEAMAMGCPLVSTPLGAEGLPVEDGKHLLRAEGPQAMAQAVLRLLGDEAERLRLSRQARAFVEHNMSARRTGEAFEDICREVLERA